jgi:Mitochondrial carrier protein
VRSVEYPFDTVKTRLHIQEMHELEVMRAGGSSQALALVRKYVSAWDCAKSILRDEGVRGFYQGLTLPLLGTLLETAVLFTANGAIKRVIGGGRKEHELRMWEVFMSGGFTGFIVAHILTPIELVKCRMQSQDSANPRYRSTLACLRDAVQSEGLGVLYRGHVATIWREVPGTACWFGAYEAFLRAMCPGERRRVPAHVTIAAGALGGAAYWLAFFPADVAKSQIQVSEGPRVSLFRKMTEIYALKGIRGLYVGLGPTLLRAAPANATVFYTYAEVSHLLHARG